MIEIPEAAALAEQIRQVLTGKTIGGVIAAAGETRRRICLAKPADILRGSAGIP